MENFIDEITLATQLHESRRTIRTCRTKYGMPYIKIGRRVLYDVPIVKEWLQNQTVTIADNRSTLMNPIFQLAYASLMVSGKLNPLTINVLVSSYKIIQ